MKTGGESKRRLTVIIPVYREHRRFVSSLRQIRDFVSGASEVSVDVIFVDDGSPDESADAIRALVAEADDPRIRLIRYGKNRGKGFAVRTGVAAAEGDVILMSDADLSTPLTEWRRLDEALRTGAAIACGSRAVPGAHIGRPPPFHRRMLSRVFNLLARISGVHGIHDTQCGFKLFRADAAKRVFAQARINRFAFDVEVIALAREMGYSVVEVPVSWDYSGHSTVRLFSSGARMLADLFLLACRRGIWGRLAKTE